MKITADTTITAVTAAKVPRVEATCTAAGKTVYTATGQNFPDAFVKLIAKASV